MTLGYAGWAVGYMVSEQSAIWWVAPDYTVISLKGGSISLPIPSPIPRSLTINEDYHEVPHGGVTGQVVDGEPSVAEMPDDKQTLEIWKSIKTRKKFYLRWPREDPAFLDVHHGEEWDGEGADDEIRHRQGEQEVVWDCLQLFVYLERYHYLNNKDCFKIPEHKQTWEDLRFIAINLSFSSGVYLFRKMLWFAFEMR